MFKSHVSVLLLRKPMSSVQAETMRDIRNRDIVCAVKMFVKWVIGGYEVSNFSDKITLHCRGEELIVE